jgi:hypothetical protein
LAIQEEGGGDSTRFMLDLSHSDLDIKVIAPNPPIMRDPAERMASIRAAMSVTGAGLVTMPLWFGSQERKFYRMLRIGLREVTLLRLARARRRDLQSDSSGWAAELRDVSRSGVLCALKCLMAAHQSI